MHVAIGIIKHLYCVHISCLEMSTCNSFWTELGESETHAVCVPHALVEKIDLNLITCSFLVPSTEYSLTFFPSNRSLFFSTLPWQGGEQDISMQRMYVSPAHLHFSVNNPFCEYLWTDSFEIAFWIRLFRMGLFCLPHDTIVLIPNPISRFCFDLAKPISWNVGKKMKPNEFSLHVFESAQKLREAIILCREYHGEGGWLTDEFIRNIHLMRDEMKFHVFELVEVRSRKIAAISIGYRYGNAFMDFTACTPIRDKRAAGKQLLMEESKWLASQGVELWYLGFQLPYMQTLSDDALLLSRSEFAFQWS